MDADEADQPRYEGGFPRMPILMLLGREKDHLVVSTILTEFSLATKGANGVWCSPGYAHRMVGNRPDVCR